MEYCIECNVSPIHIKKHKLCNKCYQAEQRKKRAKSKRASIPTHRCEVEFLIGRISEKLIYSPVRFDLGDMYYIPDFYDVEKNIFIEVAGSRQAYHQNKNKYSLFHKIFPKIELEIRLPDGRLLSDVKHGEKWNHQK